MRIPKIPEKLRKRYQSASLIITNAVLLFIGLNLILAAMLLVRDIRNSQSFEFDFPDRPGLPERTAKTNGYQLTWVDTRSYEFSEPTHIRQLLDDFADFQSAGLVYRPYVQFSDPPFKSQTLNMIENKEGFIHRQRSERATSEKPLKVFVFGGSTTMGWNVSDDQTFPVHLEKELDRLKILGSTKVTNFGRTNFSWYQEMALFQRLLHSGQIPDVAVFLDGVNILNVQGERQQPHWTKDMARIWERAQTFPHEVAFPSFIPLLRVVNHYQRKARDRQFQPHYERRNASLLEGGTITPEKTILSYRNTIRQIRVIAREFGVQPFFLWQPNRAFKCQTERYAHPLPDHYIEKIQRIYGAMESFSADDFSNLSESCKKAPKERRLFVDDVHYSPWFNHFLALRVADHISRKL